MKGMTRNISDECKQYDDQFKGENDAFDISDYIQVKDMVMDAMNGSRSINLFLYTATDTALKAGFMIGYKAAMKAAAKG